MECLTEKLMVRFGDKLGTMAVRIWRPAAPQATLFCIHGFEGNGSDFDYLAGFLVKRGLTVICPDMVGRGASTYFGDPAMYTIATFLACIGALSKYAGGRNYFLGTSWGGAVLLYFLNITRIKADKLVLNDVGMRNIPAVHEAVDFLAKDVQQEFASLEDAENYVRRTRSFLGTFSEELWPGYLNNKIRLSEGKYRLTYDPAAVGLSHELVGKQYDLFPLLDKVDGQVLLLYGTDSKCYEAETVSKLMRRRPNVSCLPDLKSGHPPSLMTYEQALIVTGFLGA
jgi:pimeloyl-ACP methyl ester carboxylesterase